MEDLKSALRAAALKVLRQKPVGEVLITEIARQDSSGGCIDLGILTRRAAVIGMASA